MLRLLMQRMSGCPRYCSITSGPLRKLIIEMIDSAFNITKELGTKNIDESAELFEQAINLLVKRLDELGVADALKEIPNDSKLLNAFIIAYKTGGADATRALSRLTGFNGLGLGNLLSTEKFVEALSKMPYRKMADEIGEKALDADLAALFSKMGSEASNSFNIAKGANHQLLSSINRVLSRNGGSITRGFEDPVKIIVTIGGRVVRFGTRIYDEKIIINGVETFIEAKAWTRSNLTERLTGSLTTTARRKSGFDTPGQLIRDFAAFTKNGGKFNVKWVFSPEVITGTRKRVNLDDLSPEKIAKAKEDIADEIIDLLKNNPTAKDAAQKALDKIDINDNVWEDFLDIGLPNEVSFRDSLINELIEIDNYENILKLVN